MTQETAFPFCEKKIQIGNPDIIFYEQFINLPNIHMKSLYYYYIIKTFIASKPPNLSCQYSPQHFCASLLFFI